MNLNEKSESYREKVLTSIVKHLPKDDDVYNQDHLEPEDRKPLTKA